ncbi:hypothetical protein [Peterkaempfera bronchialis]|uniref:hypothetical protein n=1 Tax=Peterkaempfera bronchialis TaxID=2126346 RepID=UPI003C2DF7D8
MTRLPGSSAAAAVAAVPRVHAARGLAAALLPDGGGPVRAWAVLRPTGVTVGHAVPASTAAWPADRPGPVLDRHLRARASSPHPWPQLADVLVDITGSQRGRRPAARAVDDLARRHPGALVVAAVDGPRHCTLRLGTAAPLTLDAISAAPAASAAPARARRRWEALASLIHAWLAAGLPPHALAPAVVQPLRPAASGWPGERILLRRT